MPEVKETNSECYYYNFGNNPNFDYKCPSAYGARCELYDKFFSVYDSTGKGLCPDCSNCEIGGLERDVEGQI